MKITYYVYFFENDETRIKCDISPLLQGFSLVSNNKFKKSFYSKSTQEYYFIFHIIGNIYLFIMTKSKEIIKTIDSEKVDYADVYEKLQTNQMLGFASYIYVSNACIGVATTVLGPKDRQLAEFVNLLIGKIGKADYLFKMMPLPSKANRSDVMKMSVVGRTVVSVSPENNLAKQFLEFIGKRDYSNLDAFEIIIKPKRGHEINDLINGVDEKLGEDGINRYVIRARDGLATALTDYYVIGTGYVSDSITKGVDDKIFNQIEKKVKANERLAECLTEFEANDAYSTEQIDFLVDCGKRSFWDNIVHNS